MAKRLTDTNKYRKPFIRGLLGPYKLLWDYLYHDCDHAGIWIVDFEVAQVYIGQDMQVNREDALKYFNADEKRIIEIDSNRWFIAPFIEFQYGKLNEQNRVHNSVIQTLKKYNLLNGSGKTLASPLLGSKEKDKDIYKDNNKEKEKKKEKKKEKEEKDPLFLQNDILKLFAWIEMGKLPFTKETVFPARFLPKTDKQKKSWLTCLDKLHRIDHYTMQEINGAIIFAREDKFWKDNFLSLLKLRDKDKDGIRYIDRFITGYERKYRNYKPNHSHNEQNRTGISRQLQQA